MQAVMMRWCGRAAGSIGNVSSNRGLRGSQVHGYAASKWGEFAADHNPRSWNLAPQTPETIRVNSFNPGFIAPRTAKIPQGMLVIRAGCPEQGRGTGRG